METQEKQRKEFKGKHVIEYDDTATKTITCIITDVPLAEEEIKKYLYKIKTRKK